MKIYAKDTFFFHGDTETHSFTKKMLADFYKATVISCTGVSHIFPVMI